MFTPMSEPQPDGLSGAERQVRDVLAREPALPPMIDDRAFAGLDLDLAGRIRPQLVVAGDRGGQRPGPVGSAALRSGDLLPARRLRAAEARQRRVVPQDPVAAVRDQQRDEDLAVVLAQLEVGPFDVDQPLLMLTETVEALAVVRLPLLAHVMGDLPGDGGRREGPPAGALGQDRPAGGVRERHRA
jgi:hypothetical protein